jgi:hypothetical protein
MKWLIGLTVMMANPMVTFAASDRYYRYTNEKGVTVMDSRIPPDYVKNGYEVVTLSGRVLEVVSPALSPEEAQELMAQREREVELAERDGYLLRRYSTVADIEAAKKRKLADFDASMAMLRGNASNMEAQIKSIQSRAANIERAGRQVPKVLLENLENLHIQLEKAKRQIELRLDDKKALEEQFDRDIERFMQIAFP